MRRQLFVLLIAPLFAGCVAAVERPDEYVRIFPRSDKACAADHAYARAAADDMDAEAIHDMVLTIEGNVVGKQATRGSYYRKATELGSNTYAPRSLIGGSAELYGRWAVEMNERIVRDRMNIVGMNAQMGALNAVATTERWRGRAIEAGEVPLAIY